MQDDSKNTLTIVIDDVPSMETLGAILGKKLLNPSLDQGENLTVLVYGPFASGKSKIADNIEIRSSAHSSTLRNKDIGWSAISHFAVIDAMEKDKGDSKLDVLQHPTPEFLKQADLVIVISHPLDDRKPDFDDMNEYYFNANVAELGTIASEMSREPDHIYWQTLSFMEASREDEQQLETAVS